MSETGRKAKVPPPTSAQMAEVLDAIANGSSDRVCCMLIGVHPATFYRWMELGDGPRARSPYREFREQVERAKGNLLKKCARTLVANAASARVTEIEPKTITHPDGRIEVVTPGRKIIEPGDPNVALKILRVKDRQAWGEVSVMARVGEGEDPHGEATPAELEVFRILTSGGGS